VLRLREDSAKMEEEDPRAVAQRGVLLLSEIFALGIPIMYGGFPVSGVSISAGKHQSTYRRAMACAHRTPVED
jgi:hypothetical protein